MCSVVEGELDYFMQIRTNKFANTFSIIMIAYNERRPLFKLVTEFANFFSFVPEMTRYPIQT